MRHAMLIDLDLCVGCRACTSACKEQWDSGPGAARNWVRTLESGTRGEDLAVTFYPGLCMQCDDAPCTKACPSGATHVDANGVIVVDAEVCIGCGSCVSACPYRARTVDPLKGVAEKCNLCAPYVARGETPACVATCPAEARIFGDLDDTSSEISRAAAMRRARPLVTAELNTRPKVLFAGDSARERILAAGALRRPDASALARTLETSAPLAAAGVPVFGALAVAGGVAVNLLARRMEKVAAEERPVRAQGSAGGAGRHVGVPGAEALQVPPELDRHPAGLRFLHWFNAASWVLLLVTGVALLSGSFAPFGPALPAAIAGLVGGKGRLILLHVVWGLAWAAVIVPLFLLLKGGLRHVWDDVRFTRDDLAWLVVKPLALLGLRQGALPPQDKYNAGQKLFALFVLGATTALVASGGVMAFHLGSARLVSAAVVVHGATVALVLAGLVVHVTMAAVIAEERPALRSMFTGRIDAGHAAHHSPKWLAKLGHRTSDATAPAHEEENP
jgi:formate dehydrogenase gamma subunit